MKFIIWSPPYRKNSGGVRALYKLGDILGCEVINDFPQVASDVVVVYPEIIPGNPLNAARVVRWCLRPERQAWQGDRVYRWDESFDIASDGLLYVPIIDHCYFHASTVHYGRTFVLTYKTDRVAGDTEITDEWPKTWEEMQVLFWRAKVLRCGDPLTALAAEARLCGCPVEMVNGWQGTIDPAAENFAEQYAAYESRAAVTVAAFVADIGAWCG